MRQPDPTASTIKRQQSALMAGMLLAIPVAVAFWLAVYHLLPPIEGMAEPVDRLMFAFGCGCVAILLCFVTAIEAVAHERLFSSAIDPLAGAESPRMIVNLRYLQNTLEQLMLFVPGLLALAWYSADGRSMRAVVATTAVWIVARFVFWIGYHRAQRFRAPGLVGMAQSIAVLLYVCVRFANDVAGWPGAAAVVALFAGIEAYLFLVLRRPSRTPLP